MEQAKPPTKVDSMHSWCGKETMFKSEGPNAQWDRPWEGTEAGHNATMKASQSSQVACKTDDSQMTCQLSRPRPGSTRACQSRSSPRTRNEWNPKGSLGDPNSKEEEKRVEFQGRLGIQTQKEKEKQVESQGRPGIQTQRKKRIE